MLRLICIFPAPSLKAATPPRSSGSFCWRVAFRNRHLWAGCVCYSRGDSISRPSRAELGSRHLCAKACIPPLLSVIYHLSSIYHLSMYLYSCYLSSSHYLSIIYLCIIYVYIICHLSSTHHLSIIYLSSIICLSTHHLWVCYKTTSSYGQPFKTRSCPPLSLSVSAFFGDVAVSI